MAEERKNTATIVTRDGAGGVYVTKIASSQGIDAKIDGTDHPLQIAAKHKVEGRRCVGCKKKATTYVSSAIFLDLVTVNVYPSCGRDSCEKKSQKLAFADPEPLPTTDSFTKCSGCDTLGTKMIGCGACAAVCCSDKCAEAHKRVCAGATD
ncbi:MAG: hypothetical protein KGL39_18820 [Patescibacteria group bacterium]|nr:hypothetical protein [Patescibacteria group bacterium]